VLLIVVVVVIIISSISFWIIELLVHVQVAKNRFDGELGIMLLKFDKDTLSFAVKSANKDGRSNSSWQHSRQRSASCCDGEWSDQLWKYFLVIFTTVISDI